MLLTLKHVAILLIWLRFPSIFVSVTTEIAQECSTFLTKFISCLGGSNCISVIDNRYHIDNMGLVVQLNIWVSPHLVYEQTLLFILAAWNDE